MIDAECRSEEKYSKLALAYEGQEEKERVHNCVQTVIAQNKIQPETYISCSSSGKEILVIEYHEDLDREAGDIFEKMLKSLELSNCA